MYTYWQMYLWKPKWYTLHIDRRVKYSCFRFIFPFKIYDSTNWKTSPSAAFLTFPIQHYSSEGKQGYIFKNKFHLNLLNYTWHTYRQIKMHVGIDVHTHAHTCILFQFSRYHYPQSMNVVYTLAGKLDLNILCALLT